MIFVCWLAYLSVRDIVRNKCLLRFFCKLKDFSSVKGFNFVLWLFSKKFTTTQFGRVLCRNMQTLIYLKKGFQLKSEEVKKKTPLIMIN